MHLTDIPAPQTFALHITPQEAQQIVDLIDAAVRAQGLQAAMVAIPLIQKLQTAAQAKVEP